MKKNYDKKVKIICPSHGIIEQTPRCHFDGECFKCSKEKLLEKLNKIFK